MTTNHARSASHHPQVCLPAAGQPPVPAAGIKLPTAIGKERLEALRCELEEKNNHWPKHMADTIDEDYWQLMKDFGFH